MAGYGIVKTVKADPENKLIEFQLWKSTLAQLYGKSDHPIDHLFRGMVAGAMSVAYETELDGVETACSATGSPYCEIIVKPTKSFDYSNPLVQEQLKKQ
jgi:predicted hydrocarbon binding protein